MRPLDAWHVISANLEHLYRMRRTACYRGYVEADTMAEVIAFKALQEMDEREKNEPLKLEELRKGEFPFWVNIFAQGCWKHWPAIRDLVDGKEAAIWCADMTQVLYFSDYGKTWIAYRFNPAKERKSE